MQDPWMEVIGNHEIDDVVVGKVVKLMDFGAIVELEDGLTGLFHISEMTKERNRKASDILQLNDSIEVRIIGINPARKRISFSLVSVDSSAEDGETENE